MGTEIDLTVGHVMVDWSKNSRGYDHGALFQMSDLTHIHSDQTNYEYCEEHGVDTEPAERALSRSLKSVVPRLELLGFTLDATKSAYEALLAEYLEYQNDILEMNGANSPAPLPFTEFIEFLTRHPLESLDSTFVEGFGSEDRARIRSRFVSDPAHDRIPQMEQSDGYSESSYFGSLIGFLHPYFVMRMLALVPQNHTSEVVWHYGTLVNNGWAQEIEFAPNARREQTFLIATEGSSDVHILKHAISLLMPEVQDFFRFIDVSERHPFSGTGGLVKFAEGLVKIDVQNRILFLFDNDAEGWSAFDDVQRYQLPPNMRTMVLPELDEFRNFAAFGPQGVKAGDINRRAAAIECYLDLRLEGRPPARVVWTNYKKERNDYQGSLEYKETYMRAFLDQTPQTIATGAYDVGKLRTVLDCVFRECCTMSLAHSTP
ncbi:HEPN/Toprim-associated domain-containing protein [Uliginosibacterium aquaticum]|uniref:HEPN/Toprim N-terminal domain-containing protein n=1 Tax=Uliginosibacterium aquaticum TaxID=2731212 RepID=A0ABX2IBI3_9RHOO|nr:HEPN/Toprim-associated domain-containing protein [Uliginosibacterium aquaticum]NSL53552.1 hypothetical protein [Uliginosibacterium aquaticum]